MVQALHDDHEMSCRIIRIQSQDGSRWVTVSTHRAPTRRGGHAIPRLCIPAHLLVPTSSLGQYQYWNRPNDDRYGINADPSGHIQLDLKKRITSASNQ